MLSLDQHDKFSAINIRRLSRWLVSINIRRLSRWLVSGLSLAGSSDIKDSALRCRNQKFTIFEVLYPSFRGIKIEIHIFFQFENPFILVSTYEIKLFQFNTVINTYKPNTEFKVLKIQEDSIFSLCFIHHFTASIL